MEEILISMKDIIKNVLFRHKDRQPNLASESCRDLIATEIVAIFVAGPLIKNTKTAPNENPFV